MSKCALMKPGLLLYGCWDHCRQHRLQRLATATARIRQPCGAEQMLTALERKPAVWNLNRARLISSSPTLTAAYSFGY